MIWAAARYISAKRSGSFEAERLKGFLVVLIVAIVAPLARDAGTANLNQLPLTGSQRQYTAFAFKRQALDNNLRLVVNNTAKYFLAIEASP